MNKNSILTEIYTSVELKQFLHDYKKIIGDKEDDLKQHVFLLLLEKPEQFIIERYQSGKLKSYIVTVFYNLLHYNRGDFNKIYARNKEVPTDYSTFIDESRQPSAYVHKAAETCFIHQGSVRAHRDEESLKLEEEMKHLAPKMLERCSMDEGGWYSMGLLKAYSEYGSYRAVEKETGIPHKSVFRSVKEAKAVLRKKLKQAI